MNKTIDNIDKLDIDDFIQLNKDQIINVQLKTIKHDLVFGRSRKGISTYTPDNLPFELEYITRGINIYGTKNGYKDLGLSLLSIIFLNKNYLELKISSEKSIVSKVYIYYSMEEDYSGLELSKSNTYKSFEYTRQKVEKFPFSPPLSIHRNIKDQDLPEIIYGWDSKNHNLSYDEQIIQADHLILSLTRNGICHLASLLLDMSSPTNTQDEICLEHPSLGFGGVKQNSLDIRFWLPNSFGFPGESVDELDMNGLNN